MHLNLQRDQSHNGCTLGTLLIDGIFECVTCEDQVREIAGVPVAQWKIPNVTAIPSGSYQVTMDISARFGPDSLHILDVPGFSGIRIHVGNTPADTEGCIIVGQAKAGDRVLRSTVALAALKPKIKAALDRGEPVAITIANHGLLAIAHTSPEH